jgi:hypothetical protein
MQTEAMTEVVADVACRLGTQVRDFAIVLTDDGVLLRGRTETYYAKQLVQHAVMNAITTPIVANEIEVLRGDHKAG